MSQRCTVWLAVGMTASPRLATAVSPFEPRVSSGDAGRVAFFLFSILLSFCFSADEAGPHVSETESLLSATLVFLFLGYHPHSNFKTITRATTANRQDCIEIEKKCQSQGFRAVLATSAGHLSILILCPST